MLRKCLVFDLYSNCQAACIVKGGFFLLMALTQQSLQYYTKQKNSGITNFLTCRFCFIPCTITNKLSKALVSPLLKLIELCIFIEIQYMISTELIFVHLLSILADYFTAYEDLLQIAVSNFQLPSSFSLFFPFVTGMYS